MLTKAGWVARMTKSWGKTRCQHCGKRTTTKDALMSPLLLMSRNGHVEYDGKSQRVSICPDCGRNWKPAVGERWTADYRAVGGDVLGYEVVSVDVRPWHCGCANPSCEDGCRCGPGTGCNP